MCFGETAFHSIFCIHGHFVRFRQISCTQYESSFHFRYSRSWRYVLPKKERIWSICPAIDINRRKINWQLQKDSKVESNLIQSRSVFFGVWNLLWKSSPDSYILNCFKKASACEPLAYVNETIVDIYNVFPFASLRNLALGFSELLKDGLVGLLKEASRFSHFKTTVKGGTKSLVRSGERLWAAWGLFCKVEVQRGGNSTGTEKQRIASKLRFAAEQERTHLVSSEVMTTLMELETVKKAIIQKEDTVNMDHHAFPSTCLPF